MSFFGNATPLRRRNSMPTQSLISPRSRNALIRKLHQICQINIYGNYLYLRLWLRSIENFFLTIQTVVKIYFTSVITADKLDFTEVEQILIAA
jgi:hypothetical protein